ncbi:psbP domain-containing protein 2, chloroplastic-like [Phragmites australis]|uniref:psbP domain-containing protein 2, chloroplastic-like n=1 Tax=Phragmites australis TaxID=29695 RepID=UPI002D79725F|nr:psbP domain-containing protein 2, chloroplastic-like [Phragmites australis]XP_062225684.1 psbP domain-containing protein 2, chloroplastic-like [Phragmites australis]
MPLVGCPCRGPPLTLAGRGRRPLRARAIAPKRDASSPPPLLTRRAVSSASLLLAALPFPASSLQLPVASASEAEAQVTGGGGGGGTEELELERYTDQDQGFTLLKPASWPKVEKAGATALFQQEGKGKGSNSIGVVVNPVRLSSLTEFGTPQFVADRLLQAEKKKESTKSAEVISVGERSGHGGLKVYEIEYSLDSTRGGMKRIFSAAFVATKKLYLLNIAYSDSQEKPLDSQTRTVLEQVLHSFDSV